MLQLPLSLVIFCNSLSLLRFILKHLHDNLCAIYTMCMFSYYIVCEQKSTIYGMKDHHNTTHGFGAYSGLSQFYLVLTTPTRSLPVSQPYLPCRMLSLMDLLLVFLSLMVAALVLHVLHMTAQLLESYRQSPRYINTYMATHIEVRHTQSYHSYHTLLAMSTVWHQVYAGPNKGLSFRHITASYK